MQWWYGKQVTGDPHRLLLRPQNETEGVAVSMLYPSAGHKLVIRPDPEDSTRHIIEVVVDDAAPKAAEVAQAKTDYGSLSIDDLKTLAAEKGVKLAKGDDRDAIIRKLAEAK